jgi:hypothetical protein
MRAYEMNERASRVRMKTAQAATALAFTSTLLALSSLPACVATPSLSSGGSTGSGGTGTTEVASRCEQACQDDEVAYAIDNAGWLLYDQDIAGQPSGNITRSAACPLSGTVDITGTVSVVNSGLTSVDLTLSMLGCGVSAASYVLTFTGSLRMSGTFTSMTQNDVTFRASGLTLTGELKVLDDPSVNETCDVSVTDTWDHDPNDTTWLNGVVCGRNTASGSSGASSSSGATTGSGGGAGTGGSGVSSNGGVTTCGNCPGQLECSTITGKCSVQSCACFYTIAGSDADSSWYRANDGCFMCQQNGLVTGDCTAAADAAAQAIVNCQ